MADASQCHRRGAPSKLARVKLAHASAASFTPPPLVLLRFVPFFLSQPAKKVARRAHRAAKAKQLFPRPTHALRPVTRGQTVKYNLKVKAGRGFTLAELKVSLFVLARNRGIVLLHKNQMNLRRLPPASKPAFSGALLASIRSDLDVQRSISYAARACSIESRADARKSAPLVELAPPVPVAACINHFSCFLCYATRPLGRWRPPPPGQGCWNLG